MMRMRKDKKQAGFVVTAELLLVTTILGIGLVTGMSKLRDQVISELSDTGDAIGSINQSYSVAGTTWTGGNTVAEVASFEFVDTTDTATATTVGGDNQNVAYKAAVAVGTDQ